MDVAAGMGKRNGTVGFFAALGFLGFVAVFNEKVQNYKAEHALGKRKDEKVAAGLVSVLNSIFSKAFISDPLRPLDEILLQACGMREVMTTAGCAHNHLSQL